MNFTQARHGVLAGNIANLDTPGYKARDISPVDFQENLKKAVESRREAVSSPTYALNAELAGRKPISGRDVMDQVRESTKSILYHDNSDVSIEQQVAEISKNQAQHNLALSLMTAQFRLLRVAVSEHV